MKNDWKQAVREWNQYPQELRDREDTDLQGLLTTQNRIYTHLGPQGAEFLRLIESTRPLEVFDPELEVMAARYSSHADDSKPGHMIIYGPLALRSPGELFQTRTHEFVHAIHCHTLSMFQAIPGNRNSPVILSPADACLLMELTERAAFTIERLFRLKQRLALRPTAELSAMEHGFIHSPEVTIPQYAQLCLQNINLDQNGYTSLMHYRDSALASYQAALLDRDSTTGLEDITIAKLSNDDILAVGQLLGLNLFEPQPHIPAYSSATLAVNCQQNLKLQDLENQLGISRDQDLPTLREALTDIGYTPAQYLQEQRSLHSTNNRPLLLDRADRPRKSGLYTPDNY